MVASDAALFVFVLCPLNILPVKADDGGGGGSGMGEFCGQYCSHAIVVRSVWIVKL